MVISFRDNFMMNSRPLLFEPLHYNAWHLVYFIARALAIQIVGIDYLHTGGRQPQCRIPKNQSEKSVVYQMMHYLILKLLAGHMSLIDTGFNSLHTVAK
jgi:hypothetical protein